MHQCVSLPEVIRMICEFLENDSDLLHAALVCRRFRDHALDCLWFQLSSLYPVLCTLPEGLYDPSNRVLTRPMTHIDLWRFMTVYGPRVRRLHLAETREEKAPVEFFRSLEELKLAVLTPRVTNFRWYTEQLFNYIRICPFITPFLPSQTLKRVTFHLHPDKRFHQRLLSQLLNPNLVQLKFTWGPDPTSEGKLIIGKKLLTSRFQDLRELSVPHVSPDVLKRLSRLPNLNSLCLSDCEDIPLLQGGPLEFGSPQHRQSGASFPRLRRLTIMTKSEIESIYGGLQYLTPATPLESLCIVKTPPTLDEDWNPPSRPYTKLLEWQALIKLVSDCCNPDNLGSLKLKESDFSWSDTDFPTGPIDGDIDTLDLSPLFVFKNIETLELSVAHGIWLNQDVVEAIPKAWGNIRVLDCNSHYRSYRAPRINHQDVVNLVHACPELYSLGLHFNATGIPHLATMTHPTVTPRLSSLQVGSSPLAARDHVAAFLKVHFPKLLTITHSRNSLAFGDWFMYEDWKGVSNLHQDDIFVEKFSPRNAA